jgi:hypothetical protein
MNRLLKFQSDQSGPFNASKNLIDFTLNGGTQYDMRNSYINLVGTMTQTTSNVSTGEGVYNYNAYWKDNNGTATNARFPNIALVKNGRLTCDKVGTLEDIRRVDVLRTQLKEYTENEDDMRGSLYKDLSQPKSQGNLSFGSGIEFKSTGNELSTLNQINVQIPLNHIFELGNAPNLPMDKLGNGRIHLEMNLDRLHIAQTQGANTASSDFGDVLYTKFNNVSATGDVSTLTCTEKFSDLSLSPYWVGQKLSFSATGYNTPNVSNHETIITGITYNESTQDLSLTVGRPLATLAATENLSAIECDGVDAGSISVEWTEAQLILDEAGKKESMDELQYSTFLNEEDNGNALKNFSRQYSVEETCFNLYVCLPGENGLHCVNKAGTQFQKIRMRNNNVDLTNRDVEYKTPLYYDRIAMTLLNANLPLRNLREKLMDVKREFITRYGSLDPTIFVGNPLPMTPQRKLVQLTMECDPTQPGVNEIQLYKQVLKSVKL